MEIADLQRLSLVVLILALIISYKERDVLPSKCAAVIYEKYPTAHNFFELKFMVSPQCSRLQVQQFLHFMLFVVVRAVASQKQILAVENIGFDFEWWVLREYFWLENGGDVVICFLQIHSKI